MNAMMLLHSASPWLIGGSLLGDGDVPVSRVHTDTRTVEPGDLLVALKGERFDANQFLQEAQQRGAAAAICHIGASRHLHGLPCIEVPDTTRALGQLAQGWRERFALPLIAVTGSNGKTTVTQMLASILRAHGPVDTCLATQGNFNNDIGVALTLLRLRPEHTLAVVELGMNHPGEIARLAAMAQPTVALVNNAQREHLEFMHTVQAVAKENGSVIASLDTHGVAVFPSDDACTPLWQGLAGTRPVVTFSMAVQGAPGHWGCVDAQWNAGAWQVHAKGCGTQLHYRLSIAGRHNVKNSLAAGACALAAGVPPEAVVRGLEAFSAVKGRSRAIALSVHGRICTLVDDSYNANPDSVHAAIDMLADLPGPRLLVLGDMGEVGAQGPELHAQVGQYAQSRGIEHVLTFGALARHAADHCVGARHLDAVEDVQAVAIEAVPAVHSILVKGSRFMRMERVVEALLASFRDGQEAVHAQ
jgi:UDP-N-acetylmuramoyl-tripeptide--D-alanyl-D-alanine ligase